MRKRLGVQIACLRIALVALTIQGVTPDPNDLASSSISQILHSILSDTTGPIDTGTPSGNEMGDELPDETYTPSTGASLVLRRLASTTRRSDRASALRDGMTAHPHVLRTLLPPGGSAGGKLIISLCRLTC